MDTRTDPGQYYPGGRIMVRPDVAPPQVKVSWSDIEGKPDFSDIPELEAADSDDGVKTAVNKIVDKMTTAVIVLLCGLCAALSAPAATMLNYMPGTNELYTAAETDARIAAATNNIPRPDMSGVRDKTDLAVYEPVYEYSDWTWTPANDDLTQPWYNEDSVRWEVGSNEAMVYVPIDPYVTDPDATNITGEVSFYIGPSSGTYTWTRTRMQTGVRPTTNSLATTSQFADCATRDAVATNAAKIAANANGIAANAANTATNSAAIAANAAAIATNASEIAMMRDDVAELAAMMGAERTWNRPGDWTLAYLPLFTPSAETLVDITTNEIGMVFSNVTRRVAEGLSARVFSESLDEYSQAEPPDIVSLSVSGGGTAAGNVVTVPATGLYDVKGYAANGTARQIKVSFSGSEKCERAAAYFDDAVNGRKMSNDIAAKSLRDAYALRSGVDVDGNPYTIYGTTQPRFGAKNGWGNSVPYAIAPRFAATAAHYPNVPAARAGYAVTYPVTSDELWTETYTIKSAGGAFNLATWALTNGFLEAEVAEAGISDVLIIPLQDDWQFPIDECPSFATEGWMTNNYCSLRGMTIWAVTQTSEYGIPMTVTSDGGNIYWQTASSLTPTMTPRVDIAPLIGYYNERNWWRVKVGDSGKPLWITYAPDALSQQTDILVSHFHWVGGGPNYVKAAKIVKALCQQYQTYISIFE